MCRNLLQLLLCGTCICLTSKKENTTLLFPYFALSAFFIDMPDENWKPSLKIFYSKLGLKDNQTVELKSQDPLERILNKILKDLK